MKNVITAGGIVIKKVKGIIYICLIIRAAGRLGIPKGHLEEGETLEHCAMREVHEETGLHILEIQKKLGVIHRRAQEDNGEIVNKEIHVYFIHTSLFQDGDPEEKYEWFTLEEAVLQMEHAEEAAFLKTHFKDLKYE